MRNNERIPHEVEQALNSLDGLKRAEASAFLFTRIQQRMRNHEQVNQYGNWLFKLAVVLILFMGANVYSYSELPRSTNVGASPGTGINAFANEYGLQQTADNI